MKSVHVNFHSLPCTVFEEKNCEEQCSICLDAIEPGKTIRKLPCGHKFHDRCLKAWFRHNFCCPNCRVSVFVLPDFLVNLKFKYRALAQEEDDQLPAEHDDEWYSFDFRKHFCSSSVDDLFPQDAESDSDSFFSSDSDSDADTEYEDSSTERNEGNDIDLGDTWNMTGRSVRLCKYCNKRGSTRIHTFLCKMRKNFIRIIS